MAETLQIRDFFNTVVITALGEKIATQYSKFDLKRFLHTALSDIDNKTYSERKETLTDALIEYLPDDFSSSVDILLAVMPQPYPTDILEDTQGRFYITSITAYISRLGMEHFDLSMKALYEFTKCFTSEFDIRPFILKYPDRSFELLSKWALDPNPHVRRLVSEGSRPNLPWGKKLKLVVDDPVNTTLPLLEILKDDPSEYVRKSVANHLNDLTKSDATLVITTLERWKNENPSKDKLRLINHALRSMIKSGNTDALALIGYDDDFDLKISFDQYDKTVAAGGNLEFQFTLVNQRATPKKLLIDYFIGYQKKDGSISEKVFKLKKTEIAAHESLQLKKKQSFKPITTRVYYPGTHTLGIQINGKVLKVVDFVLGG